MSVLAIFLKYYVVELVFKLRSEVAIKGEDVLIDNFEFEGLSMLVVGGNGLDDLLLS